MPFSSGLWRGAAEEQGDAPGQGSRYVLHVAPSDIEAVRERLLDSAHHILDANPNTKATVQEIAALAGISTRTFYLHFADKDAFLYEYWTRRLSAVEARLAARVASEPDPVERLRIFGHAIFESSEAVSASRGVLLYHLRMAASPTDEVARAHRPLLDLLSGLIRDAQDVLPEAGDPTRLAGAMLEMLVASVLSQRLGSSVSHSPPTIAETVDFCLRGVGWPSRAVDPSA